MRSTSADPRVLALACALALAAAAQAAPVAASAPASGIATEQAPGFVPGARALAVEAAVDKLRDDPLLAGRHATHTLEWISEPEKRKKPDPVPEWFKWIESFMRFVNDTSRVLVYGLVAVAVAVLLVSARHLVQLRAGRRRAKASAISHVRDLDVRPESLPEDVGAAAWALWQSGQVAAALSLLYRGALSRLIHRHAVPIAASTTEGECLELAQGRLAPAALRYLTQLVRAREANVYGERTLSLAMGEVLCDGFATRLDATASTEGRA
jgi:hypothetical protein